MAGDDYDAYRTERGAIDWARLVADGKVGAPGNVSDRELGRRLGCDKTTVTKYRKRFGVAAAERSRLTEDDWAEAAASGLLARPLREVERVLRVDRRQVSEARVRFGVTGGRRAGGEWPDGALAEVRAVLERNDRPPPSWRRIPARKMVERLRDEWGVYVDEAGLDAFVRERLGRRSWRDT